MTIKAVITLSKLADNSVGGTVEFISDVEGETINEDDPLFIGVMKLVGFCEVDIDETNRIRAIKQQPLLSKNPFKEI